MNAKDDHNNNSTAPITYKPTQSNKMKKRQRPSQQVDAVQRRKSRSASRQIITAPSNLLVFFAAFLSTTSPTTTNAQFETDPNLSRPMATPGPTLAIPPSLATDAPSFSPTIGAGGPEVPVLTRPPSNGPPEITVPTLTMDDPFATDFSRPRDDDTDSDNGDGGEGEDTPIYEFGDEVTLEPDPTAPPSRRAMQVEDATATMASTTTPTTTASIISTDLPNSPPSSNEATAVSTFSPTEEIPAVEDATGALTEAQATDAPSITVFTNIPTREPSSEQTSVQVAMTERPTMVEEPAKIPSQKLTQSPEQARTQTPSVRPTTVAPTTASTNEATSAAIPAVAAEPTIPPMMNLTEPEKSSSDDLEWGENRYSQDSVDSEFPDEASSRDPMFPSEETTSSEDVVVPPPPQFSAVVVQRKSHSYLRL